MKKSVDKVKSQLMIKSPFSSNILTLVAGTTFAQIITILASPIITRLDGPGAFGLVALFTSIASILNVVACLRYEFAIVLSKSDKEGNRNHWVMPTHRYFFQFGNNSPFLVLQQPLTHWESS